jgi:hypothetical protein
MKSFPIVIPGSHGVTTVIGTVILQDDVVNQMVEVVIQTREGFTLNPTIDIRKHKILEFLISNQPVRASMG